jgi:hypothetical protein
MNRGIEMSISTRLGLGKETYDAMAYFGQSTYDFHAELETAHRRQDWKPLPASRRRTTPELREQVIALRRRGMVPGGIAKTLDTASAG